MSVTHYGKTVPTTMVRKITMNGRRSKRQNCSLQTTRGNCERGRDDDGIRSVMKQYYARLIVHRSAGDGATICFFLSAPLRSRILRARLRAGAHIFRLGDPLWRYPNGQPRWGVSHGIYLGISDPAPTRIEPDPTLIRIVGAAHTRITQNK